MNERDREYARAYTAGAKYAVEQMAPIIDMVFAALGGKYYNKEMSALLQVTVDKMLSDIEKSFETVTGEEW